MVAGCGIAFSSCNVLELDPTGWYGEDVTYASVENLDLYVKGLYDVLYSCSDISSSIIMDDGMSDLIKYSWYTSNGQVNRAFYEPTYVTVNSNFRNKWDNLYQHVRKLNEYFYDLSNGYGSSLDQDQLKIRTAEVRFLRAFCYQELIIRYGGVPLRISEDHVDGPEDRALARSSEEDCWDFVIGEYDKAAQDLPQTWAAGETGRITKGAAYGMKARASLYAGRWQDAIDACDLVFGLDQYSLLPGTSYSSYYQIFTSVNNSELILPVYFQQSTGSTNGKQHNFNTWFCPPDDNVVLGVPNAAVGAAATPSDEYASAFDIMVDGEWQDFSWDNLESYGNRPFDGREPRFYASILYDGANWLGRNLDLSADGDCYMDFATSGQDAVHKTTTGYIFRKFMSDSRSINFTNILSGQYWIEMRLAEIYLIRSEANARLGQFGPAYEDLNEIRTRVGLPEASQTGDWDSYLQDLSKERVCELGLEGHRWYDLVRWGIAQEVLDGSRLHGIRITRNNDGTSNYERVECDTQDRLFPERMNIFPIPYTEIRNNSLCVQNEQWL